MVNFRVSDHALQQYKDRVLGCPERQRSDNVIRAAIREQIEHGQMQAVKECLVVGNGPWKKCPYLFVIDDNAVVTTLGFMMRPKRGAARRHRARRAWVAAGCKPCQLTAADAGR